MDIKEITGQYKLYIKDNPFEKSIAILTSCTTTIEKALDALGRSLQSFWIPANGLVCKPEKEDILDLPGIDLKIDARKESHHNYYCQGAIVALEEVLTSHGVSSISPKMMALGRRQIDPLENQRVVFNGLNYMSYQLMSQLSVRSKIAGIIMGNDFYDDKTIAPVVAEDYETFMKKLQKITPCKEEDFYCDVVISSETISTEQAKHISNMGPTLILSVNPDDYSEGALDILQPQVLCLPEFLTGAGHLLATLVDIAELKGRSEYSKEEMQVDLIHSAVSYEIRDLLMEAVACTDGQRTTYQIALDRAETNRRYMLETLEKTSMRSLARNIILRYSHGLLKYG